MFDKKRYHLECTSCPLRGACAQCAYRRCTKAIHPYCALHQPKGFRHRIRYCENADSRWEIYCETHAKYIDFDGKGNGKRKFHEMQPNNNNNNNNNNNATTTSTTLSSTTTTSTRASASSNTSSSSSTSSLLLSSSSVPSPSSQETLRAVHFSSPTTTSTTITNNYKTDYSGVAFSQQQRGAAIISSSPASSSSSSSSSCGVATAAATATSLTSSTSLTTTPAATVSGGKRLSPPSSNLSFTNRISSSNQQLTTIAAPTSHTGRNSNIKSIAQRSPIVYHTKSIVRPPPSNTTTSTSSLASSSSSTSSYAYREIQLQEEYEQAILQLEEEISKKRSKLSQENEEFQMVRTNIINFFGYDFLVVIEQDDHWIQQASVPLSTDSTTTTTTTTTIPCSEAFQEKFLKHQFPAVTRFANLYLQKLQLEFELQSIQTRRNGIDKEYSMKMTQLLEDHRHDQMLPGELYRFILQLQQDKHDMQQKIETLETSLQQAQTKIIILEDKYQQQENQSKIVCFSNDQKSICWNSMTFTLSAVSDNNASSDIIHARSLIPLHHERATTWTITILSGNCEFLGISLLTSQSSAMEVDDKEEKEKEKEMNSSYAQLYGWKNDGNVYHLQDSLSSSSSTSADMAVKDKEESRWSLSFQKGEELIVTYHPLKKSLILQQRLPRLTKEQPPLQPEVVYALDIFHTVVPLPMFYAHCSLDTEAILQFSNVKHL
jgi:hypothetical protein